MSGGSDISVGLANDPESSDEMLASLSFERATSATLAPFAARSRAVANPIPDDAPVTMTTLPSILTPVSPYTG